MRMPLPCHNCGRTTLHNRDLPETTEDERKRIIDYLVRNPMGLGGSQINLVLYHGKKGSND